MASRFCGWCGKALTWPNEYECSVCQSAHYCSHGCTSLDLPLHSLICPQFREVPKSRPAAKREGYKWNATNRNYIQALLLPKDSDTPRLVWVAARQNLNQEGGYIEQQTVHKDITEEYKIAPPVTREVTRNGRHLRLFMAENKAATLIENTCLRFLSKGYTTSDPRMIYCGDIIICAWKDTFQKMDVITREKTTYIDIDYADLRYILDDYVQYRAYESSECNDLIRQQEGAWVQAVMLHCDGDVTFNGKEKYQDVYIHKRSHTICGPLSPTTHGQDLLPDVSTISHNMGMTLRLQKMMVDPSWLGKMVASIEQRANTAAKFLMIDTDIENKKGIWGTLMAKWNTGIDTTVLVAREDHKNITAKQVEILCRYCREIVEPSLKEFDGTDLKLERKRFAQEHLESLKFEDYFLAFMMQSNPAGVEEDFKGMLPQRRLLK